MRSAEPTLVDEALRDEVLLGLGSAQKTLPPKLFYDAAGAALFERICALPEYYPTRTELAILRAHAGEIAQLAGPGVALIEYGSGAGVKVRLLLDALERPAAYVPVDISEEQLLAVAAEISADYALPVLPVAADYTRSLDLPAIQSGIRRLAFFPGSTIGNFHRGEAVAFLRGVRDTVGTDGALVLGVDRRKDPALLHAAYDDAQGVTAEFNRNILHRLNNDFGADFDVERFAHRATFNDAQGRVEMHLVSDADQTVRVGGEEFAFGIGETIWTESSYKYDDAELEALVAGAGFSIRTRWTDADELFWVAYLTAR